MPGILIFGGATGAPGSGGPPDPHSPSHIDGAVDEITSALDARAYPLLAGTVASRPAAGVAGRPYWATDEHILYRDNGTTWDKASVADYDDLTSIPSTFAPASHASSHNAGGGDALAIDAAAGTGSLRTLGTGATTAAAGNDNRFPAGPDIVDSDISASAAIAETKLNLASDAAAGVASRRTLGTGATQAAAGDDNRFPAGAEIVNSDISASAAIAQSKVALDQDLVDIGNLSKTANRIVGVNGSNAYALHTISAFTRDTLFPNATASDHRADLVAETKAKHNILDFGAIEGSGAGAEATNVTAINNACATATATSGVVVIPDGLFEVNDTLINPGGVMVELVGDIRLIGAGGLDCLWQYGGGVNQHLDGGMVGKGKLYCRRKCQDGLKIDCWRNGTFKDFIVYDPINAMINVVNTVTTADKDCDTNTFDHITMKNETGIGILEHERPRRIMVFDGTGNNLVTDMQITNCIGLGGLLPTSDDSPANGVDDEDGGVGFEVLNADRLTFDDCRAYSHVRRDITGTGQWACHTCSFWVHSNGSRTANNTVINNFYTEAAPSSGTVWSGWRWYGIKLETQDTSKVEFTTISGFGLSTSSPSGFNRFLKLINNGSQVQYTKFINPRKEIFQQQQIDVGSGCSNNYLELLKTNEPFLNSGGATNNIVPLTTYFTRTLFDFVTTFPTPGTAEVDAYTANMLAAQLNADGDKLQFFFAGQADTGSANKRMKVLFGNTGGSFTTLCDTSNWSNTGGENFWQIHGQIIRQSSSIAKWWVRVQRGPANGNTASYFNCGTISASLNLASTTTLKLALQSSTAGAMEALFGSVLWIPTN